MSFRKALKSESIEESKSNGNRIFRSSTGYRSTIFTQFNAGKSKKADTDFYFEAMVSESEVIPQTGRIGIATIHAELNGPIGMDTHGYSLGIKNGYVFHQGKRIKFGERIGKKDVISCLLIGEGRLMFFVNGNMIGSISVENTEYFPAISVFVGTSLEVNLGPYFIFKDKIFQALDDNTA